jgi:acyl carrier protein
MNKTDIAGADERTKQIVDAAIDALNEQLKPHQRISKDPDTILSGPNGKLDSIGFVNLVVMLEGKCQEHCGAPISLTDALSGEANPFDSVATLIAYLHRRLTQEL